MKPPIIVFILFLIITTSAIAQDVESNYEMPAQKTNCDNLLLGDISFVEQISAIENSIFRYKQDFKLNRKEGFQAAWYYSCDGNIGFVIAKIDDKKSLYQNIDKDLWTKFSTSGDFLSFIENNFKTSE